MRADDFIDVVKLSRAAGDRRFGTYDHDANRVVGPASKSTGRPKPRRREKADAGAVLRYEKHQDPATGAILYRRKP